MSLDPFDSTLLIARLATSTLLKSVEGSAELATAMAAPNPRTPSGYVMLASERGDGFFGTSEPFVQRSNTQVEVAFCVRNYKVSELGMQAKDSLRNILIEARALIVGWIPPVDGFTGFSFLGGRVESYTNANLWWVEAYGTNNITRVIPQ